MAAIGPGPSAARPSAAGASFPRLAWCSDRAVASAGCRSSRVSPCSRHRCVDPRHRDHKGRITINTTLSHALLVPHVGRCRVLFIPNRGWLAACGVLSLMRRRGSFNSAKNNPMHSITNDDSDRHSQLSIAGISGKLEQAGMLATAGKAESEIARALDSVMTFHRWCKLDHPRPSRPAGHAGPGKSPASADQLPTCCSRRSGLKRPPGWDAAGRSVATS
jgi:hypothetical protein